MHSIGQTTMLLYSLEFHSNYGSVLFSFRDMTIGRITDDGICTTDGLTSVTNAYLTLKAGQLKSQC